MKKFKRSLCDIIGIIAACAFLLIILAILFFRANIEYLDIVYFGDDLYLKLTAGILILVALIWYAFTHHD